MSKKSGRRMRPVCAGTDYTMSKLSGRRTRLVCLGKPKYDDQTRKLSVREDAVSCKARKEDAACVYGYVSTL